MASDTPFDDGTLTFAAAQRRPTEPDGDLVSPTDRSAPATHAAAVPSR
ncbi:hypothetical protein GS436_19615 [Rhodococcus hoagii]|nr:hypothetical protein [Prescottella equi]